MARRRPLNGSIADQPALVDTTGGTVMSRGILMRDPVPADKNRKRRLKQEELRNLITREQRWLEYEIGDDVDSRIRKRVKIFSKELGRLAEGIQPDEPLRSEAGLEELIERIRNLCTQTGRGLSDAPRVKNAINDLREDLIDYLQAHYALRAAAVLAGTDQDTDDTDDDTGDDALGDALDDSPGEPIDTKKMVAHLRGLVFGRLDGFVGKLYEEPQWNVAEAITLKEVEAICRSFNALADALESAVTSVVHEGEREVPLNVVQRVGVEVLHSFESDKTGLPSPACPHFKAVVCEEATVLLVLVANPDDLGESVFAFPVKKRLELSEVQALFRHGPHRDAKEELTNTPWSQAESDFVAQKSGEREENSGALALHLNEHFHGGVEVRTATSVNERIREIKLETETMDREEVYMRFRGAMISRLPSYVESLLKDPAMSKFMFPLAKDTVNIFYQLWDDFLTWLDEQLREWAKESQSYPFALVKDGMFLWLETANKGYWERAGIVEGGILFGEIQRFKECVWGSLQKAAEAARTLEDFRNPPFVLPATEFSEDTLRQAFRPDAYKDWSEGSREVPMDDHQDEMIEQWDGTDPQAMVDRLNNDFHGGAPMWTIEMLQSYRTGLDGRQKDRRDPAAEGREPIPWKARYSGMLVRQLPEFVRALFGDSDLGFNQRISEGELYALLRVCRKNMLRGNGKQVVIKWPGLVSSDSIIADRRLEKKISEYLRQRLLNPVIEKVQRVVETRSWGGAPSDYAPLEGNREINLEDFQDAFRPIELRATWPWSDEETSRYDLLLLEKLDLWGRGLKRKRRRKGDAERGYTGMYTVMAKGAEEINRDFHGGASVRKVGDSLVVMMRVFQEDESASKAAALFDDTQVKALKARLKDWIEQEGITNIQSALGRQDKLDEFMVGISSMEEPSAVISFKVAQLLALLSQLFEEIEAGDAPASDATGVEAEFDPNAVSLRAFNLRLEALIRRRLIVYYRNEFMTKHSISESSLRELHTELVKGIGPFWTYWRGDVPDKVESFETLRTAAGRALDDLVDKAAPTDPYSPETSKELRDRMKDSMDEAKSQLSAIDPRQFMQAEEFAPFDAPLSLADLQEAFRPSDYRTGLPEAALNLWDNEYRALEEWVKIKSKKRKGSNAASQLNKKFHGGAPVWSDAELEAYIERRKRGEANVTLPDLAARFNRLIVRRTPAFANALKEAATGKGNELTTEFLKECSALFSQLEWTEYGGENLFELPASHEPRDFWLLRRGICQILEDSEDEIRSREPDRAILEPFLAQVFRPVRDELLAIDSMVALRRFLSEPLAERITITVDYLAGLLAEPEPATEPEPAEEPELMPREHEMLVTVVGAQIERFEWADAAACTAVMLSDAMAPVLDRWAVTLTRAFHGGTTAKRTPALLRQVLPLLIGEIYARRAGDGADGRDDGSDDKRATGDESGSRHLRGGSLEPRMTELPPVAPVGEGAVEQVDPLLVEEVRGLAERVDEELRAVEAAGWKRISIPHKILAVMARRILRGDLPHTTAQLVLYREFLHGFRALFEINDPQDRPSLREVARGDFEEGFLNVMIRLGQCLHLNDFETEPAWAALVNLMQSRQRQREAIRQAIAGLRAEVEYRPEAVERELRAIRYVLGNASDNVRHGLQENLDQLTREHDALQAKQQALTDLEAQEEKLRDRHAAFLEKLEALIAETLTESD